MRVPRFSVTIYLMGEGVSMSNNGVNNFVREIVQINAGGKQLPGNLCIPPAAQSLIVFVHGSGSSRFSSRNIYVADYFNQLGFATLLFDLLTKQEEQIDNVTAQWRFDISLLARRVIDATQFVQNHSKVKHLDIGYFGASTGAAAALVSAACLNGLIKAAVSRGGRPDLAEGYLSQIRCPTLFIVGQMDTKVISLNKKALALLPERTMKSMEIIPGATHLFEEPGALDMVARSAGEWFMEHLNGKTNVA